MADLELEVDRLRKQGQFLRHEVRDGLRRIERLTVEPVAPAELAAAARDLDAVLRDLDDTPGYHPAHDQVVADDGGAIVSTVPRITRLYP